MNRVMKGDRIFETKLWEGSVGQIFISLFILWWIDLRVVQQILLKASSRKSLISASCAHKTQTRQFLGMHGMLKDMEYSNVTFTILIPKGLDIRKVGIVPGKFYECQVAVYPFSLISSCLRMGSLSLEVYISISICLMPLSYDNIMDFIWFALCVPWQPRVHTPFPDERQRRNFFPVCT